MDRPADIAARFTLPGRVARVTPYGTGKINETYLVTLVDSKEKVILQRLNPRVFPEPESVMRNLVIVCGHLRKRLDQLGQGAGRVWQVPVVYAAGNEDNFIRDADGCCWRAISYVGSTSAHEIIRDQRHAMETGRGLGLFHLLLSDLDPSRLSDTLPGFHITPQYMQQYDRVIATRSWSGSGGIDACIQFVEARRTDSVVLEQAKSAGTLRERVIHGDPKVSNFLCDRQSGRAVSLIDLDTVKPGLILYDIGDCLRSACNPAGEDPDDPEAVHFDLNICRSILHGYMDGCCDSLGGADIEHLFDAVRLIAFELGLRFFTDYLAGSTYFRVSDAEQNLRRAQVQFRLAASIEQQESAIRSLLSRR